MWLIEGHLERRVMQLLHQLTDLLASDALTDAQRATTVGLINRNRTQQLADAKMVTGAEAAALAAYRALPTAADRNVVRALMTRLTATAFGAG